MVTLDTITCPLAQKGITLWLMATAIFSDLPFHCRKEASSAVAHFMTGVLDQERMVSAIDRETHICLAKNQRCVMDTAFSAVRWDDHEPESTANSRRALLNGDCGAWTFAAQPGHFAGASRFQSSIG